MMGKKPHLARYVPLQLRQISTKQILQRSVTYYQIQSWVSTLTAQCHSLRHRDDDRHGPATGACERRSLRAAHFDAIKIEIGHQFHTFKTDYFYACSCRYL